MFQLPAQCISPPASLTFSGMPSFYCPIFHVAVSQEVSHQNDVCISYPASHLTGELYQSQSSAPSIILFTYHICWHKHTSFSPGKFPKIILQDTKVLQCNYSESWVGNGMSFFFFWFTKRSDCAHSRQPNNVQLFIKGMLLPVMWVCYTVPQTKHKMSVM